MRYHLDEICLGVAVAFALVIACIIGGCRAHTLIAPAGRDRAIVSRALRVGSLECTSELPLILAPTPLARQTFEALQPWRDALGFDPVVLAHEGEAPTLIVRSQVRPPEYPDRLGQVERAVCRDGVLVQTISLFVDGDGAVVYYTLMHEIGHALGANLGADEHGHSPNRGSIMFPTLSAASSRGPAQWVTADDVAAVRRAWGLPTE